MAIHNLICRLMESRIPVCLCFGILALWSCSVDKPPPEVHWVYPSTPLSVEQGEAIQLQFTVADPPPTKGTTQTGSWRITVGPSTGATWWTQSGTLSAAPKEGVVIDTITATWQPGEPPSNSMGTTEVLITAVATDGEGQSGADFATASLSSIGLQSEGLWWTGPPDGSTLAHATGPSPTSVTLHSSGSSATHIVHLDGQDLIATGSDVIQGWKLNGDQPQTEPEWTIQLPLSATASGLRHLRRAPHLHTQAAWLQSGWSDRCVWHDAQGALQRSWVLETQESLLDAGTIGERMFVLARTDAGEFRLIQWNIDTGARIDAVTWTPTATGSLGPEGRGWLLEWNGLPAGLESDGTLRVWNPNGGATPISTAMVPGSGEVQHAGRWGDGRLWVAREVTHFLTGNGFLEGTWPAPIQGLTEDRASNRIWVLSDFDGQPHWNVLDIGSFSAFGESIPAGNAARNGCVAHNRPGPI